VIFVKPTSEDLEEGFVDFEQYDAHLLTIFDIQILRLVISFKRWPSNALSLLHFYFNLQKKEKY